MFIVKSGVNYVAGIDNTGLVLADSKAGARVFEEPMRGFWAGDPAYTLVEVKRKKGRKQRDQS